MKILSYFIMLSMVALLVQAQKYDLLDYPEPFIQSGVYNTKIVVGDESPSEDVIAAIEINEYLKQFSAVPLGSAILASEVETENQNLILVGSPCNNALIAKVLGYPLPCDSGLPHDEGVIYMVMRGQYTYLIVTGSDSDNVRRAARALRDYEEHSFTGQSVEVEGSIDGRLFVDAFNYQPLFEKKQTQTENLTKEFKCQSHDECSSDEKCSPEIGCEKINCAEGYEAVNHICVEIETPENETETQVIEQPKVQAPGPVDFFKTIVNFFKGLFN